MVGPRVYCDMDGVLVDLEAGYKKVTGHTLIEAEGERWEKPLEVDGFWENLPKMADAAKLVSYLEWGVPDSNLFVLSSPQRLFPSCGVEKLRWLDRNTPIFRIRQAYIVERARKQEYALGQLTNTPNILIDDYIKNIEAWREAGGIGIHHTDAKSTIAQMLEYYPSQ